MAEKTKTCDVCGAEIAASAKTCPSCGGKNKKPVYKKWWFWGLVLVVGGYCRRYRQQGGWTAVR